MLQQITPTVVPSCIVDILSACQLFLDLGFNLTDLLAKSEVIVELGLGLTLAWELRKQQVEEENQSVMPIADLNDAI